MSSIKSVQPSEKPPESPEPPELPATRNPYTNRITLLRFPVKESIYHVGKFVLGNTLVIGTISLCLWGTSWKEDLAEWGKRSFNVGIIMLSAILSFGIGHLLEQLGMLARGQLLASNAHTPLSIGYIIQGSMTAVARLLQNHIFHRPRTLNRTTLIATLYLVFNISARLSVAFLGFTFNIEESIETAERVAVSTWPVPNQHFIDKNMNHHQVTMDTLFEYAVLAVRLKSQDAEARTTNLTSDTDHEVRASITKAFVANGLVQTLVPDKPIAKFEYSLREFKGNATTASNRSVVVETECHAYLVPKVVAPPGEVSLRSWRTGENVTFTSPIFNTELYPLEGFAAERLFIPPAQEVSSDCAPPLCIRLWTWDKFLQTPGEATYRCDNRLTLPQVKLDTSIHSQINIPNTLAEYLLRFTASSESSVRLDGWQYRDVTDLYGFTNFARAIGLDEGYSNGEIWTAAVLGRVTSVLIMYLDEVFPRVYTDHDSTVVRSKLLVRWDRMLILVLCLTGGQILLATGTIVYCKGSVLIPDDVSPLGELVGTLAIPRSATFAGVVSDINRRSAGGVGRSHVQAGFSLKRSNGGVRRWILEVGELPMGGE